jgi:hypothetical protein
MALQLFIGLAQSHELGFLAGLKFFLEYVC